MHHYQITVSGKVQGVWFRKSTQDKARELGLRGFVRNQPDGSVYIEASGSPEVLSEFIDWCRQGPPMARVDGIAAHPFTPETPFEEFHVRH
jgi:acylphosphatase